MPVESATSFCNHQFNYLIIGGGTAGLALAVRLSEDPKVVVGVIEAGEWNENVPEVNVPGFGGRIIGTQGYDWSFMSIPQCYTDQKPSFQARGKALGGTSMLNLMAFNRSKLGNPGWNWFEFLKYMKKSETTIPGTPDINALYSLDPPESAFHGDSGPIVKSYPTAWWSPLQLPIFASLNALGVPTNRDAGKGDNIGVTTSYFSINPRTATRSYSANAYYAPNSHRRNLFVVTGAHVTRILFDDHAARHPIITATGIEFLRDGEKYVAKSSQEVIVSAGSFQTPQILELSGIGRKEVLSQFGIEQLVDLPGVGENLPRLDCLQDHIGVRTVHEIDPTYETADTLLDSDVLTKQLELYKVQKGMLCTALASCFACIPTDNLVPEDSVKQWSRDPAWIPKVDALPGLGKQYDLQKQWLLDPRTAATEIIPLPRMFPGVPEPGRRYSSAVSGLMHPLSRGTVHISSGDPLTAPAIDPGYLSNPLDLDILLSILKYTLKIYKTGPLNDAVRSCLMPSPEESTSDERLLEYIKHNNSSWFHPIGTASMMPRIDGGVVDPSLKVYGTMNVRVVDCSVIPLHMACHPQTIAYAIAEKAADIIKDAHHTRQ
ncbi:GMC oxidoreductase [Ramaria rubella]|nr:GMC oxidoreductase [Ramaria rubella]